MTVQFSEPLQYWSDPLCFGDVARVCAQSAGVFCHIERCFSGLHGVPGPPLGSVSLCHCVKDKTTWDFLAAAVKKVGHLLAPKYGSRVGGAPRGV